MASTNAAGYGRMVGKVVLVAGASSGMGRATAFAFAEEGADLALVARRREPLEELAARIGALSRRVVVCPADLTDPAATERVFARATEQLGPLDVVVITAGTNIRERALTVLSQDGWDEVIAGNIETAFQVTRAAVPRLRGRGGRIIYVSSLAVQRPDTSGVAYQVAKHAVVGLAHGTMQEEKGNGIRTTVIFPGLTNTPLILKRPVPTPPEVLAKALQPEDIALACVFIATLPSRANVPELQISPAELY
jgi:NADP-dependent 3-hydroxy acid dehydrogenase YdfG